MGRSQDDKKKGTTGAMREAPGHEVWTQTWSGWWCSDVARTGAAANQLVSVQTLQSEDTSPRAAVAVAQQTGHVCLSLHTAVMRLLLR